jgi:5-deoxy-D-glucuronate isomerase
MGFDKPGNGMEPFESLLPVCVYVCMYVNFYLKAKRGKKTTLASSATSWFP